MQTINENEIRGYKVKGQVFCLNCVLKADVACADQDNIITEEDIDREDSLFLCADCGERIY